MGKVFANEVNLDALTRTLTDAEGETWEFWIETGRVYTAFFESINEGGVVPRHDCRLRRREQTWRHSKDGLRHLRWDHFGGHFGLANICKIWCTLNGSLTLAGADVFPGLRRPKVLHQRQAEKPSLQANPAYLNHVLCYESYFSHSRISRFLRPLAVPFHGIVNDSF